MVVLVGAVLALSVWTVHRAGREALHEFRAAQARLAQDTSSSLRVCLEWFDRDTRLLATLASGTRKQSIGEDDQASVILNAFDAVVTSVLHYRTIALFHRGRAPIVAVDPNEDRPLIVAALASASDTLAMDAIAKAKPVRAGPLTVEGGRFFYLYAVPSGPDEAVVVSSDAALMLESVSRRPTDAHGLIIVDPSGAMWLGCEQRARCRFLPARSDAAALVAQLIEAGTREDGIPFPRGAAQVGLPSRAVVGVAGPASSPLGTWSVAVMAPAADLDVHQRAFLWQLIVTSVGVVVAMLAVGLLILRQHSNAAALRARLQAAEEVARLQRQLVRAEKLVTVGVLSAGIAHEIGTPLAVVRGRAEHMLERPHEARDTEDLQAVVGEIDRISSTIRQVLDFSSEQAVTVRKTDARTALARALELLQWRLAGKHVRVDVDASPDLPPLAAAADQLEQVLLNLLLNACDASPPDGAIRVAICCDGRNPARAERLRVEVADRGSGIPSHHLNAVFDPYFTTKKRGEGTGLGLAIVWQIVRAHRGEISLRSAVGVGTVATVIWPTVAHDEERRERVA
jgi:signal transduction histidine kinase